MRSAPLSAVLREAADPHSGRGKTLVFHPDEPDPELRRQPTILRADKVHEFTAPAWTGDPRPFMADTDWTATYDLARGLADTAAWYRNAGLL